MGFWSFLYGFIPDVWFNGMNVRTYTGLMLSNSIKLRRRDRPLRKALDRLNNKYTPDRIAEIYRKYSSVEKISPRREERRIRKFQKKLERFINEFLYDYKIFRIYYLDALQLISQSLLGSKRQGNKEFVDIEALFADLDRKRTEMVFPIREIEVFKGQLRQLLNDLLADIRYDEQSDTSLERGGYPTSVSFFSFFSPRKRWSRRKLYRREKKEIRRLGAELQFYDQLYARINDELQKGVRQDFLFLLIELFKRVDVADKRLEDIRQDLDLVLKRLWDEVEGVKKSLSNILNLLKNEPQVKNNPNLAKIGQDIEKLEEIFRQMIAQDFKNTEALRKKLKEMLYEENVVIAEMEEQSMKIAA